MIETRSSPSRTVAGVPEAVQYGIKGYVVKLGSSASAREALARPFSNPPSLECTGKVGRAPYRVRFTCDRMVRRYEVPFRDVSRYVAESSRTK